MSKVKTIVLVILLSIVGIILFFILRGQDDRVKLNRLLQDISMEVVIDGKKYAVQNGRVVGDVPGDTQLRVLRVVAFYQWHREDPLFDSPDLDIEGFVKAIKVLDQEQKGLLQRLGRRQSLQPVAFLYQFAESAKTSRRFLQTPSSKLAQELLTKQQKTVALYRKDAKDILSIISPPEKGGATTFNIELSSEVVVSDFQKIVRNADSIEEELTKRQKCLLGTGECTRPLLSISKPNKIAFSPTPPTDNLIDPAVIYRNTKYPIKGPYRTVSPCWGFNDDFSFPEHYFYVVEHRPRATSVNLPRLSIQLATDLYYIEIPDTDDTSIEYKVLRQQGATYIGVGASNMYTCLYADYFGDVAAVDLFLENTKPLFQEVEQDAPKEVRESFLQAKKDEERFFQQEYPSYQDLSALADHYAYAYHLLSTSREGGWGDKLVNQKEEFLLRYLRIKRKLGNIHKVFTNGIEHLHTLRLRFLVNPVSVGDSYIKSFIYTFRTFYGLSYLSFSPSVWRSSEKLEYQAKRIVKGAIGTEGGYISYHQAKKMYPPDEFNRLFLQQRPIVPILEALIKQKGIATESGTVETRD